MVGVRSQFGGGGGLLQGRARRRGLYVLDSSALADGEERWGEAREVAIPTESEVDIVGERMRV